MQASILSLAESDLHDFLGNRSNLNVHLQRCDTLRGTSDLEVHITKMILVAQDIGENGKIICFLDQSHGYACDWIAERYTCVH